MITSRPKAPILFSVGMVIIVLIGLVSWVLFRLIFNPAEYFIVKLFMTPLLLVLAILIANRSFFSYLQLSLGDNKLTYKYLMGKKYCSPLSGIDYWSEEVVKRRKTEFRQLTIAMRSAKKLQLSNHEHSDYDQIVTFLNRKVRKLKK